MMTSESVVLNNNSTIWAPYKHLYNTVFNAVVQKDPEAVQDLEVALKKNKPSLICLLRNPPRSHIHREAVKKASTTGIVVSGQATPQFVTQILIDEALLISDMFDLNEVSALELLIASQNQQPRFPGLTRGLVAMLLYYDGRRNLVNALQLLVQAREGRTWNFGLTPELSSVIMRFTNQLKEEGIIMKVIDVLEKTNITEELELLHRNRALGGPKYRKQVTDLMKEIKGTLAEIVYNWACQGSLSQEEVTRLLSYLSKHVGISNDGSMDEATLTMAMAFLYVIDVSTLQVFDESDVVYKLNILTENDLSLAIHKQLMNSQEKWQMTGLKSIFQLAWGVTLRTLSQFPVTSIGINFGDCLEEDEKTVDAAIEDGAFQYLKTLIVKNSIFHQQEYFLRRIHTLVTDFIVLMPLKVKDLRNRGDETARIIASHVQADVEPPENLPYHFEHLLNLITELYAKDPSNLALAAEYWCPTESLLEQSYFQRPTSRQIALYKFIRLAGDMLPPPLFVPYHQMLTSLSNSPNSARNCYVMLKMNGKNGSQINIVSWDHFFATLHRYYNSLHEEVPTNIDLRYAYPQRMHTKGIAPQEVQGLIAVLQLISQVVKLDEIARITLSENPQYMPTVVLLGLITCSIPAPLKAALINCLTSFASSPEIALNIWQGLEMAQVVPTVKSVSVYHPSGILMELEEVETRMEEYPVTRAMLSLLDSLLNHPYPPALGSSTRQPGIEPYIQFVRDSVLLRCNSRAYKIESEKWKIMGLCFKILEKVLKNCCFSSTGSNNLMNTSNVGISVLSQILQDSELLRVVLFILDEGMRILDQYASVSGQSVLEDTTLLALRLIYVTLSKQEAFLQQVRESGCDLLVTSLDNLLLNINPRSGQADHLLVIAKYVTYNVFLPQHSLYAISILHGLCSSIHISQHLVGVFDSDPKESEVLLKGFVEIFEADSVPENNTEDDKMLVARNKACEQLLQLILKCLKYPGPNLSHYLLGFNLRKPIAATEIQEPGVMGSKYTCLHAILSFLTSEGYSGSYPIIAVTCPYSAELAYKLIFTLCTNRDTSGPTLRFLRSTHDFLFRHLLCLPFKINVSPEVNILRQQSWLLRTLAVELRITSAHHQRSHVQRLLNCLLDDKPAIESGTVDISVEPSLTSTNLSSFSFMKPSTGTFRKKLMQILDYINFQHCSPSVPHWDYFENGEIERILKECEVQEIEGPRLINVEILHNRLSEETSGLKNASIMGQRPIMMQEITKVLQYAVNCNESRELVYAKQLLFDAWRQVTEVLFIACPLEILGSEKRDQLVLEISQELLSKILSVDVMPELMPSASGVILTLMSTLRHSVITSLLKPVSQTNNTLDNFSGDASVVTLTHHSSLLVVLRNVVECLFKTGSGFQRVRANFYSAFLNLLCIVQKPYDLQSNQPTGMATVILDQETEARKLRIEYMDTILSYGETIMEIVCRDACTGHDITKMLSLAVLDVAISLDTQQQWLAFLVSKGYLRHILDSLSKDDDELQNLFNRNSNSFRIFYVFDSKMALLTRISCCTNGALALLRNGAIHKLAECRALDLRPDLPTDLKEESSSWILPDLLKCYRQMFMAIMRLILSITMTLGSRHREATLQLLEFVVCNGELFSHVIRDPANLSSLEALEELSVISAVLSRAQMDDPSTLASDTFLTEQRGHLLLLRQNSLLLLQRLFAIESAENKDDNQLDSDVSARMKMYRLQITSYIIGSCCGSVVKSGPDIQSSILFSHHIAIASAPESYHLMSSSFEKRLPLLIGRTPDLGLLITLLYRSASDLLVSLDDQKLLTRRLQSLPTLTSDELAEFIPPSMKQDQPSVQLHREIARNCLQKLLQYKDKEISILSYIIESSSFVLLKHLEYYFASFKKETTSFSLPAKITRPMRHLQDSISSPKSPQILSSPRIDTSLPSQFDFESFKTDVQATLGEPFFRKLKPIEQHLSQGKGDMSFLEAMLNRMKRLVRTQAR